MAGGPMAATIMDFAPMANIPPFGMCMSLANPQVAQRLAQFLPPSHQAAPEQAILELAGSAQFRQQLAAFSQALTSGQLDISQFGLQPTSGASPNFSVADFLASVQAHVDSLPASERGEGDTEMADGEGEGDEGGGAGDE